MFACWHLPGKSKIKCCPRCGENSLIDGECGDYCGYKADIQGYKGEEE